MAGLTRAQILAADDLGLIAVEVPEWGGTVYVRGMSGKGRLAWERDMRSQVADMREAERGDSGKTPAELEELMAERSVHTDLLVRTVCDENGSLLFTHEDIAALEEKSWTALERVLQAAAKASGIALGDEAPAAVEALGNSSGGTMNTTPVAPGSA